MWQPPWPARSLAASEAAPSQPTWWTAGGEKTTAEMQSSFQSQLAALEAAKQGNTGNGITVNPVSNSGKMTPAQVYAQNVESVVSITNQGVTNGMFGQEAFTGSGSGFILTADGYVLTNHHVIDQAQTIRVTLYDGTEYEARLVGSDAISDVALLKIDAQDLPAVTIGAPTIWRSATRWPPLATPWGNSPPPRRWATSALRTAP